MDLIVPNELLRGARFALDMEQETLAQASRVTVRTVRRVEAGARVSVATLEALATALETVGVTFLHSEGAVGPGLRMPLASPSGQVLRAARSARNLTLAGLSRASGVSESTIFRMESRRPVFPNTIRRLREALEEDGVTFLSAGDAGGPGFRVSLELLSRKDLRF